LHLSRWNRLNRSKRRQVEGAAAPDRDDEYLIYQTLAGMWTSSQDAASLAERLQAYMIKASREAKRSTSWLNPDAEYEEALGHFIAQLLENPERNAFLRDFSTFVEPLIFFGGINSLVQVALKLTVPGVPDIYQGTERLTLSLVDPDNRRPVDYEAAARQLEELQGVQLDAQRAGLDAAKLFVTSRLLQARKNDPALFERGSYQPLQVEGDKSEHVVAYARVHEERCCVVVLPRWSARLKQGAPELPLGEPSWGDLTIALPMAGDLRDAFTHKRFEATSDTENRTLRVADVLASFPVAVLFSGE
jgi:(1->4)-alpha-D-glucan 1-alpha-D-glucosylmutase